MYKCSNLKKRKMKTIKHIITILLLVPVMTFAGTSPNEEMVNGDTVIIELNKNSKIIIYTKDRGDLAQLQNYDINQMIRDLNEQLGNDSVRYLELRSDEGRAYVDEKEVDMNNWRITNDQISIKLGNLELDVDPEGMDDFDEDDWERRKKVTYEADRVERTTHHFNVDIGLNNWLEDGSFPDANNSPYSVKPFGSWYIALNSTNRTWVGGPIFIEWGLGVSWYNWKLEDPDFRIEKTDQRVEFTENPLQNGLKSKLTASYINAHFVPMFDFSRGRRKVRSIESEGFRLRTYSRKGVRFGLGGYVGYRLGSHSKFVFKEDSTREKDKDNGNFFLENVRYGLRAQIGWKGVELFGTYDLNEVFSSGRGPQGSPGLNAITFGITL